MLVLIVLAAVFAPWLAPFDPYNTTRRPFVPPVWSDGSLPQHWLGTDGQGRDMLSRACSTARALTLVHGPGRRSSLAGGSARWSPCSASTTAGSTACIMRAADILLSFPAILLGLALAAVARPRLVRPS